ncbi:MAG TPA: pyridoxamine 5'-phosphate oxidase [Longimicrobiaceae bacterium]|nr:pyridoxamine 5'-phosphate oxidase [Longimicrobiaceae bacterium]
MSAAPADPIARFAALLERAHHAGLAEPTAMSLATADAEGRPSNRMVLLKDADARGFVFYTNLGSRKAREIGENPHAALCFFWQPLEVQVRVTGRVEPVGDAEADAYYASRPRGSQIGAWASKQSTPLAARAELDRRIQEITERYEGQPIPRPPFWSGFRVVPEVIEFWHGQPSRLHERDVYTRDAAAPGGWRVEQLYP